MTESMLKAIKSSNCLSIGFSRGQWPDLSFLVDLSPGLKRLRVQSTDMDWESICQLASLEQLRIDGEVKEKVDLSKLKGLKSLEYYWGTKNFQSVLEHKGIEHLIIYGAKAQDLSIFQDMSSLKRLDIVRGQFESLNGVEDIPNLRAIKLNDMTKLVDVSALNELPNLIYLGLANCNKVQLAQSYSGLKQLKELSLLKQKNVQSLEFVASIPNLEVLKVFEMSLKGGDLSFLTKMKHLKSIRMDMKKHYSLDVKELSMKLKKSFGDYEVDFFECLELKPF